MQRSAAMNELVLASGGELWQRPCPHSGIAIRGLCWLPKIKNQQLRTAALMLHGLQSNCLWWADSARALQDRGIAVLAVDRRGSGLSDGYPAVHGASESSADGVGGARGHHQQPEDFLAEIDLGVAELRQRCAQWNEKFSHAPEESPKTCVHLIGNCFASRIALAYCAEDRSGFASLAFTSPATDMAVGADLRMRKKLRALYPFRSRPLWIPSPLRDEFFLSQGPKLAWIRDDSLSLSLRSISSDFVRSAVPLNRASKRAVSAIDQRLLLVTADRDVMVNNAKVIRRFQNNWRGELRLESFDCEHMIDFSETEGPRLRRLLGDWVLGEM